MQQGVMGDVPATKSVDVPKAAAPAPRQRRRRRGRTLSRCADVESGRGTEVGRNQLSVDREMQLIPQ